MATSPLHSVLRRLGRASVATVLAFTPIVAYAAPPPSPVQVRLDVRAPFTSPSQGPDKLAGIENHGFTPFAKNFSIPYDVLQTQINDAIDDLIPNKVSGVEVCTDPCPDVTWSVKLDPKFKFTKKNQPTLAQIGASGQSKVRVELVTEARIDVHADVHAETWFDSADTDVDAYAVVGLRARVDVSLWPELKATKPGTNQSGVELEFTLVSSNIDLDINGQAAALGFKWGTLIGLSPIGVLVGGPILGPILAFLGDAAADAATEEIGRLFDEQVAIAFEKLTDGLEDVVNDHIDPFIAQANDLKNGVLATNIPGPNKTLEQLASDFGAQLVLHTVASTSSVHSVGLMRFSDAAAGGKISGKLRLPKKQCEYASVSVGGMKGSLPLGLVDANTDLVSKVGTQCSAAVTQKFERQNFLGHNPRDSLGASAQNLPNWSASAGTLTYVGTVTETNDWYECGFELTGLPKASVLKLEAGQLAERAVGLSRRVLQTLVAGKSVVFDEKLQPLAQSGGNSIVIVGGAGVCGSGGMSGGLTPNKMKEFADALKNCPQCGFKLRPGTANIYELGNMNAFFDTKMGRELKTMVDTARATVNPVQKAAPAVKGKQIVR